MKLNQSKATKTATSKSVTNVNYCIGIIVCKEINTQPMMNPTTEGGGTNGVVWFRFVFLALNIEISQLHGPQRSAATNFSATVAVEEG